MKLEDLKPTDYIYDETYDRVVRAEEYQEDYYSVCDRALYKAYLSELKLDADLILSDILESLERDYAYEGFEREALDYISNNTKQMFKTVIKQIEKELPQTFTIFENQKID